MQQLSIFMYKVKNRLVPDYLCDLFTNVSDIHNYDTRQSGADLILPKPKTNSMKNAFSYTGAEAGADLGFFVRKSKFATSTMT